MAATPEAADPLDSWTLPPNWTESARDLFAQVLAQRPGLCGADLGSLEHACALTSAAERLDTVALAGGTIAAGSTGRTVVHPAVVEARLARTLAATILARLAPSQAEGRTEQARRAARTRWTSSVPIGGLR